LEHRIAYLSGLSTSCFADEDEGLAVTEDAKEFVLLLPDGKRAALLKDLVVPRRKGPPVPSVDGWGGRPRRGAVGGGAELGGDGGLVDHIEEAHLSLPFRSHGGVAAARTTVLRSRVAGRAGNGARRRNPSSVLEGSFERGVLRSGRPQGSSEKADYWTFEIGFVPCLPVEPGPVRAKTQPVGPGVPDM
jgi:hypothetical protein